LVSDSLDDSREVEERASLALFSNSLKFERTNRDDLESFKR
jgi:hypothetical protein